MVYVQRRYINVIREPLPWLFEPAIKPCASHVENSTFACNNRETKEKPVCETNESQIQLLAAPLIGRKRTINCQAHDSIPVPRDGTVCLGG
jgi:hypothetical protein